MTSTQAAGGRPPVVGNAAAGLGPLLASLGISDSTTRDSVEESIAAELVARGLDGATVRDLRWGTLTLSATAQAAQLLRFDGDNLLAALEQQHPGVVTRLRVQVTRR